MNVSGKTIYFYLPILFVLSGCTKLSPELGFGFLNSSDESLTIEASTSTINSSSANAVIQIKGLCEDNTHLSIIAPTNFEFKCENLSYTKELPAGVFNEGENFISVEAYDNSKNKIATKKIRIVKDTVAPTVNILGPTNIPSSDATVAVSGSCSEQSLSVEISEVNTNSIGSTTCLDGAWTYTFTITDGITAPDLKFVAVHRDDAGNSAATNILTVSRNVLSAFSILGIKNSGSTYSNLIKQMTGDLTVGWTSSVGASSYDIYIQRNVAVSPATVCSQLGLTTTAVTLSLTSTCVLTHSEDLRVKVVAWDSQHSGNLIEYFTFTTKAPASIRPDAKILYINSDPDTAPSAVSICHSDLIYDANSAGPFTITIVDSAGLGAMVSADNVSATRALVIAPTTAVSGIYPIQIQITDENALTSASLILKIAIVYPYSWSGLVSNDFNNKDNWCGVAGLKTGCSGASDVPIHSNRVFIDSLCLSPQSASPASYTPKCSPTLSTNTTVRSFSMKYGTFSQNGFTFSAGTLADAGSYFKMSAGQFNDGATSGDINVFRSFLVEGGMFNAPKNSTITLNTNRSSSNSEPFKVTNNSYFAHNGSTLSLADPNGRGLNQYMSVPSGFELKNLVMAVAGGHWSVKSTNLIVSGHLTLNGAKDGVNYPLFNSGVTGARITLAGDLICSGIFGGGNLPVYINNTSAKYKTTHSDCKYPQIKVTDASVTMTEDSSSNADSVFQSLIVSAGKFAAPASTRRLIIRSSNLDDNTVVASFASGTFIHNNGRLVFQTGDNGKNYKLNLSNINEIEFSNAGQYTSFYEVDTAFSAQIFHLSGIYPVPVRGYYVAVTADQIIFDTGFVFDSVQLSGLIQSGTFSTVQVNTTSTIHVPYIELKNALAFTGSSTLLDFSGTRFALYTSDVVVGLLKNLKYYSKSGSYDFIGLGIHSSGY